MAANQHNLNRIYEYKQLIDILCKNQRVDCLSWKKMFIWHETGQN